MNLPHCPLQRVRVTLTEGPSCGHTCRTILVLKYLRNTVVLVSRSTRASASYIADSQRSSRLSISGLTHEQLQYRTRYTTKRYASHAPYWQFVIWSRQLALTVVSLLPDLLMTPQEQDDMVLSEGAPPALIWLHAGLAVGIFGLSYVLQRRMQPFVFDFQNWVEQFLLVCSAITVLLAALYTLFDARAFVIEILLFVTLIGSIAGAALYLGYDYRRNRLDVLEKLGVVRQRVSSRFPRSQVQDLRAVTPRGTIGLTEESLKQHVPPPPPAEVDPASMGDAQMVLDEASVVLAGLDEASIALSEASLRTHLRPPPPPVGADGPTLQQLGRGVLAMNKFKPAAGITKESPESKDSRRGGWQASKQADSFADHAASARVSSASARASFDASGAGGILIHPLGLSSRLSAHAHDSPTVSRQSSASPGVGVMGALRSMLSLRGMSEQPGADCPVATESICTASRGDESPEGGDRQEGDGPSEIEVEPPPSMPFSASFKSLQRYLSRGHSSWDSLPQEEIRRLD